MKSHFLKIVVFYIFIISFAKINAQEIKKDTTRHQANIKEVINGKVVTFAPELSPLRQVAGAPPAYWKNYWEFGDGHYSFKEKPKHKYKEQGEFTVRLSATNNYDDGEPPLTRPKKVNITDTSSLEPDFENEDYALISNYNGFRIQNNREPSPDQEMQLVLSYANDKDITTNGKLYFFFNDKKFKNKNFELVDIRSYHNEEEVEEDLITYAPRIQSKDKFIRSTGVTTFLNKHKILNDTIRQDLPQSLEQAKNDYYNFKIFNVNDIEPKEERNLFFTLKTTPEMLKDTSAILTIRSIYVPERGSTTHKITEKEMEIVTSHDPNKMAVYNTKLNYRLVRFKRLKYKIRFQNNGEGPARLIKLNTDLPKMLDRTTLKVIDMYPKVPICPDNKEIKYSCLDTVFYDDKVSFQFKNIYLPGSNQKGVHQKDSTKGFVKYSMKFSKDFHKVKSTSQTAIIFDKNPPIITNRSTSSFKPGISIGAKAGYNYFFTSDENLDFNEIKENTNFDTSATGFFAGVTISPYKSYKWYWQSEIMASVQNITSTSLKKEEMDIGFPTIVESKIKSEIQKNYLDIVPISMRYNVNSIIGLGFGPQVSLNGWQKARTIKDSRVFSNINGVPGDELQDLERHDCQVNYNKGIELNNYGIFADITVGTSRIGPSIGIRYIQNFNQPTKQLQTYAIWKF